MQALLSFAQSFGLPQRIQAVGANAVHVSELLRSAVQEHAHSAPAEPLQQGSIVKWVVLDRCADLCTPLMSQLTLEGRLDELQNIAPATGWLPGERGAGALAMWLLAHCSCLMCGRRLAAHAHTRVHTQLGSFGAAECRL